MGGKLYGITKVEDLFSFDLALLQDEKMPTVTDCKQVIRQPLDKQCYDYVPWSDVDDEEDQENNDDDGDDELASISGEKYGSSEDEYEEEKELE